MKNLLLFSLLLFAFTNLAQAQSCNSSSACCAARAQAKPGISKTELRKIIKQSYQQAKINQINYKSGYYSASLVATNNQPMHVLYTEAGKWQSTRTGLNKNALPAKVQKTLKQQNHWNKVSTAYKMTYPTRKAGYVAKTSSGQRIDFDYKGNCLTNGKCAVKCTKDGKCDLSKCTKSGKCDVSKCATSSCKPSSCAMK